MRAGTKVALWIGGLLLAAVGTGAIAYAVTEKVQKPALPAGTPTLAAGQEYLVAGPIPAGTTTVDALIQALGAMGFDAVSIVYFGPQGVLQAAVPIPFSVSSAMFVAHVTASKTMAVPAGMSYVAL